MNKKELIEQYSNVNAVQYDERRKKNRKWVRENEIIEEVSTNIQPGDSVLDIPVGTGRFLKNFVDRSAVVSGADFSEDMLKEARGRIKRIEHPVHVFKMDLLSDERLSTSFDWVVCIRIINWFNHYNCIKAVCNLAALSNRNVVLGIRLAESGRIIEIKRSLGHLYRTIRAIVSKKEAKPAQFLHRKNKFYKLLDRLDLKIKECFVVDDSRKDSVYYIFWLEK